ncbi:hypothetical protein Y032_0540g3168 [Ancylostoma ceylanicum]|uniref:Uncharacterized protein n=1 Tax=Ancylostoma ceylanicum TaxID=53326 RepID=A0A016WQW0_9BILA|nr:hypothetical protein Y032_0540g3168 [Ancylostoma ceylanicum]
MHYSFPSHPHFRKKLHTTMGGRRRPSTTQGEVSEMSPTGSDSSVYSDKKKQTHLRCERQRREAINVSIFAFLLKVDIHQISPPRSDSE